MTLYHVVEQCIVANHCLPEFSIMVENSLVFYINQLAMLLRIFMMEVEKLIIIAINKFLG